MQIIRNFDSHYKFRKPREFHIDEKKMKIFELYTKKVRESRQQKKMKKRYQLFFNDLGKSDLYIAKHYLIKRHI